MWKIYLNFKHCIFIEEQEKNLSSMKKCSPIKTLLLVGLKT